MDSRADDKNKKEQVADTPVMFETLEPRILMSATPVVLLPSTPPATTTVEASSSHPAIVQETNGAQLSVSLHGQGAWQITDGPSGLQLTVTGTNANSQLTLSTGSGAPHFLLNGIDIQAAIGSVSGQSVDVQGNFTAEGAISSVSLGDFKPNSQFHLQSLSPTADVDLGNITDLNLTAAGAIGSLAVNSWIADGNAPSQITGTSIGQLSSQGNFGASLSLSGALVHTSLNSVSVGGAITGGLWYVVGDTGKIAAGSVAQDWDGDFTNSVQELSTSGDFDGQIATPRLTELDVGGNLSHALLLIGADLGADGKIGGTGANADQFGQGEIDQFSVGGSVIGSRIRVGVDPVDGVLDDGSNTLIGGTASKIGKLTVEGTIDAASTFVAGAFPRQVSIDDINVDPLQDGHFHTTPIDLRPTLSALLAGDTGVSATDAITSNDTVAGKIAAVDGVGKLVAGFDAEAPSAFADLTKQINADSTFTLTPALLAQLAGGTLADGPHTLHLIATDIFGNARAFNVQFTLATKAPSITAGLAHDTGSSATDGVTSDDTISGTVAAFTDAIVRFSGGFDSAPASSFVDLSKAINANGSFTLTAAQLANIAGGTLADGKHTLHLTAVDQAGNATSFAVSFTLDTAAPVVTVTSAPNSVTNNANLTISGTATTPDAAFGDTLSLTAQLAGATGKPLNVALGSGGVFTLTAQQLAGLSGATKLADGSYAVQLTATDAAGNASTTTVSFTLDTAAPVVKVTSAPNSVTNNANLTISGTATTPDAVFGDTLSLTAQIAGATSKPLNVALGSGGAFTLTAQQLAGLLGATKLADGSYAVQLTATDTAGNVTTTTVSFTLDTADPVQQWDQITLSAIQAAALDPASASRVLAIESVAVLDTINAIDGTPAFMVQATALAGTSADAAIATAAHEVLVNLFPGQATSLDAQYRAALANIGDGSTDQGKANGIALGLSVADQVLALRANDGSQVIGQFDDSTQDGQWRSTGPTFGLAIRPEFANVTPFVLSSPNQFLSTIAPPPGLTSAEYLASLSEVQSLGSAGSTTRTADQTQSAQFWGDNGGTLTEAGQWNQIAEQVALKQGSSLADEARLFGELNVGLADSAIATWNAKYNFDLWSPVSAVQKTSDPNFTPLLNTPEEPEYVQTQASMSATAADILGSFFGQNVAFSAMSASGATRNFTSFSQAAQEAGRSGIFAGTDFQFSNVAGQALGRNVGDAVLKTFDPTNNTSPPKVEFDQPTTGLVTNKNPVITGHVLNDLSGVASLEVKIDNGTFVPVTFDKTGKFSVPVNFPLDGSADGQHTVTFLAKDVAGNTTNPLTVNFTLASQSPQINFTNGLADGALLQAGTGLTGNVTTSAGVAVTGLSYSFDGGTSTSVVFDTTAHNSFNQAFDLSKLGVGMHTLTVTASDAAGNVTTQSFLVALLKLIPLTITSVNPADGAGTVGVTFRPFVTFSRAVDVSTLTSDSFFLTDSAGNKIATTIVPWADHMHAWLFPSGEGLPGGQTITLHVDGSKIVGAADGQELDAAGTGQPGSVFTTSFQTVNNADVAGTSISGQILDPGPQLDIGTTDTPRPIAGVTVYILGHEDEAVQTDAQGRFTFASAPVGDVKVVIDGRTATNNPTGVTFPVLVVDLNVKPGQDNTIEGSRGSVESQLANTDNQQLFLPRLSTDVMQTLNQNAPTVLHTTADSSPTLTPEQLQEMTLTVAPGSLIGEDGQPLPPTAQVGFSVVPRDTIKDMLPPGLSQHSFDLTIQAPGLSSFTTPAQLTLPNVFNLPPGSKTNLLTFDYTTGRLEIDGTCTVSADGKTVTTDPGSGVTKIGWHSMTPAGSMTSNTPMKPPTCSLGNVVNQIADTLISDGLKAVRALKDAFPAGAILANGLTVLKDGYNLFQTGSTFINNFNAGTLTQAQANATAKSLSSALSDLISLSAATAMEAEGPLKTLKTALAVAQPIADAIAAALHKIDEDGCATSFLARLVLKGAEGLFDTLNNLLKRANDLITDIEKGVIAAIGKMASDQLQPILTKILSIQNSSGSGPKPATSQLNRFDATAGDSTDPIAQGLAELPADLQQLSDTQAAITDFQQVQQQLPDDNQLGTAFDQAYNVLAGSPPNAPYAFFLPDGTVIRGTSDANGSVQAFLPPNTTYQFGIVDARYNTFAMVTASTGPSGTPSSLPDVLHFQSFDGLPDSNGDGLPDAVKAILGLNPTGPMDQIVKGMTDLEALDEGLNATSTSLTTTTGIVASVPLQGEAKAVALAGSTNGSNQQTAYVATGSYGLAILDATNAKNPVLLSQLKLSGNAVDVAVDSSLKIAAVATGSVAAHRCRECNEPEAPGNHSDQRRPGQDRERHRLRQ